MIMLPDALRSAGLEVREWVNHATQMVHVEVHEYDYDKRKSKGLLASEQFDFMVSYPDRKKYVWTIIEQYNSWK